MKNIIGIFREGISKRGEKRVAITPEVAKYFIDWKHQLLVQSRFNPKNGEIKRAFDDQDYSKIGAKISEDLSEANVIFGLKEIDIHRIIPEKAYLFFSHTHKGQIKNRAMLRELVDKKATIIDYELIRDEKHHRLITAFTYNAGYAGMVDSLWTLGKRLKSEEIENPFEKIPQAVDGIDLHSIRELIAKVGKKIENHGTPKEIPPIITVFLGKGKTSKGAQDIYDILPTEEITIDKLKEVYIHGSRKKVYKLVLRTSEMYRPMSLDSQEFEGFESLNKREKDHHYIVNSNLYESNLDEIIPYTTVLMNCITWSPQFPRLLTNQMMKNIYRMNKCLQVIGDITCDPNGSIEFSKETWIDNPVYIYDPTGETQREGFVGKGIAVMAVTNLPCEFSADASCQFSNDLEPFLKPIAEANYKKSFEESNLPEEIKRAVIMWHGEFTDEFFYMRSFLRNF